MLFLFALGGCLGNGPLPTSDAAAAPSVVSTDSVPTPASSQTGAAQTPPVTPPTPPDPNAGLPPGTYDYGHTQTNWANNCPAGSQYACMPGFWGVQNPTTVAMPAVRYETAHFALRWEGALVSDALAQTAGNTLEMIWTNHTQSVGFKEPYCNQTQKFKVNVHIDPTFGLTGGGTGVADPAFWISPASLTDHWGLAHEFTHALQFAAQGLRDTPYGGWFWEDHANFMAHTLPEFHESNVHCSELMVDFPHIYLGSTRVRYCSWQFLEFLKDKYCYSAVNNLWTQAPSLGAPGYQSADPWVVMAQTQNWNTAQLNDFFGEYMLHNVTWDYRNPDGTDSGPQYRTGYGPMTDKTGGAEGWRQRRTTRLDPLASGTPDGSNRYVTPPTWAPQRWGYNLVQLFPTKGARFVKVTFRGVLQDQAANTQFGSYANQPSSIAPPSSDWRWGLVAADSTGTHARYSALQSGSDGTLSFVINPNDAQIWLMVMATPQASNSVIWDQMYYSLYRYPWMVQLDNAVPEGFQAGDRPSTGGQLWPNGGGWVASVAHVDPTVYVGPQASVLGGTVTGQARIEDHAVVVNAMVGDNAVVRGISVLAGGITVSGNAQVNTTFQPPGTYEPLQVLTGSAQLIGDVELRGVGLNVSQGVFYGFVDAPTSQDVNQGSLRTAPVPEVTAAPAYVWRP